MNVRLPLALIALGGLLVGIGFAIPWPEVEPDALWGGPNPLAVLALLLGIVAGGVGLVLLASELLGRWLRWNPTLRGVLDETPARHSG